MREITDHKVDGVDDGLMIHVVDEPGSGGANHRYAVSGFDTSTNKSWDRPEQHASMTVLFQNGPIKEAGINGVTHEVLLAIIIDRLRSFQLGSHPDPENAAALIGCQQALAALKRRTEARLARGVEGTMQR